MVLQSADRFPKCGSLETGAERKRASAGEDTRVKEHLVPVKRVELPGQYLLEAIEHLSTQLIRKEPFIEKKIEPKCWECPAGSPTRRVRWKPTPQGDATMVDEAEEPEPIHQVRLRGGLHTHPKVSVKHAST